MTCVNITANNSLIITQYEYSDKLKGIISGINGLFQNYQLNTLCEFEEGLSIDNAFGWSLNRIGDNHGYPRPALPSGVFDYWGFDDNGTNYDQAPFFYGSAEDLVPAGDEIYKQLLRSWIKGLFYDGSVLDANKAIMYAFGKGYLIDHENLHASIVIFDQPYHVIFSVIRTGVIPRVAGIKYDNYIMQSSDTEFFGFDDASSVGFDQEAFVRTVFEEDILT